jgi:hypothetical protein
MSITRQNYELIFVDYLDGHLSESAVMELMLFLEQNPDLKPELENFENLQLVANDVHFEGKELLKKDLQDKGAVSLKNFQEFCVAFYEKELPASRVPELKKFVFLHPELEEDFKLFGQVYLRPDKSLVYPTKRKLKRGQSIRLSPFLVKQIGIAAAIAILAGIFFLLQPEQVERSAEKPIAKLIPGQIYPIGKATSPKNGSIKTGIEYSVPNEKDQIENQNNKTEAGSITVKPREEYGMPGLTSLCSISLNQIQTTIASPNPIGTSVLISSLPTKTSEQSRVTNEPALSVKDFAFREFKEKILADAPPAYKGKITFWDITGSGIKGFNRLTGSHIHFKKQYNTFGELVAVKVDSKNFGFSFPVKN